MEEQPRKFYLSVSNLGEPLYDDIVNSDLPKEEKVKQIKWRGQAYRDELDNQLHKDYARIGLGGLVSAIGALPIAITKNPVIGSAIGGGVYELGQGIMEGDEFPELMQRAGWGGAIGGTVGGAVSKLPDAARFVNNLSGGRIGNVLKPIGDKITNSKLYDALMTDVRAFNPNKQTVYHGSPYDFEKFSNEAIGTGEGAQAHGYGHYAALDKDIADKRYRKGLLDNTQNNFIIEGQAVNGNFPLVNHNFNAEAVIRDAEYYGGVDNLIDKYKKDLAEAAEEKIRLKNKYSENADPFNDYNEIDTMLYSNADSLQKVLKNKIPFLESIKGKTINKNEGQLYKLSVPKDDVMLREGATFAQQPKKVQEAIKSIVKENPELAEVIDTRTADEFFEIAQKKLGKKGKNIMKEVFDAELSGDENKIINAWDKYNEFESKNPNITRTDFDPNKIYGYLKNYRNNGVDETGQLFQNQYSNTNLYKYLEDEKNFNKALYDKGIKGISYNGGIDGEARVIFNPDDIVIGRKYYNQPNLYQQLTGKQNTGALVDALLNR